MRFFFVDRVDELEPGKSIRGIKNISINEDFLQDHFPDNPIYPGTLIIEALAQLGGFLVEVTSNTDEAEVRRAVLAQVEKAKFYEPVTPGDQLEMRCELISTLQNASQVSCEARAGGKRVATAQLMYILGKIDSQKVHQQRKELYRLWTQSWKPAFPIR